MSDDPDRAASDSVTSDSVASDGDTYTEYSSQSWFGRLKGALIGLVIGILLVPIAVWLLAWNEGRAVTTARALAEGSGAVVEAAAARVDPANQGRLVHLSGPLEVPGALTDPEYGVNVPGAAKLVRHAEMFQWEQSESHETHNKPGGGSETVTTYRYARTWSATPHDSSKFKQPNGHANPAFKVHSGTKVAQQGHIGAFKLDKDVLGRLGPQEKLPLKATPPGATLVDGAAYLGADPQNPALGDMRITYLVVHPAAASVVARQDGDGFGPYTTTNGRTLLMVSAGQVPAAAMFDEAKQENVLITWGVRLGGALAMLLGFYLLMLPVAVLASVLPFLGDLLAAGAGLVALLATVVLAPLVIAVAWLAVRPLVGGAVLAGGAVAAILIVRAIRNRRPARPMPGFMPAH